MRRWLITIGGVLASWLLLVVAEHLAVGIGYRDLIAGSWEMGMARNYASPIALALLLPVAVLASVLGSVLVRGAGSTPHRKVVVALGALAGGAFGLGISTGRHFARWLLRAPFCVTFAVAGAAVAVYVLPALVRLYRAHPGRVATGGFVLAMALWVVDARVLPHLYPWFHLAAFLGMLGAAAPLGGVLIQGRVGRAAGMAMFLFAIECALWTPRAAAKLSGADNLRLVLVDHAPLMGRAALFAVQIAPPKVEDDAPPTVLPGEIPRALDWSGRDILLITIDALRADHLGAYGYPRATSPNIDRLAAQGVTFLHAYCATPNTSYSLTSLLTGKYMRPLLELGMGGDSETWASLLRRYGYRTAAFYPPAVFFVDPARFTTFESRGFDFEYKKTQFATPGDRAAEVTEYLRKTKADHRPMFLWVHLFEPHEPYDVHPDHVFGDGKSDIDLYDGEIASADEGIGKIIADVRAARPRSIVIVSADHGEEFGEHGGRYHGTTVYEEQVRVPLIVSGEGIPLGKVEAPVQTVDLLPTVLSAFGIPRPARVRGRDLGPLFAGGGDEAAHASGGGETTKDGLAYVESDAYRMVARRDLRLVCERRAAACALYDLATDPLEKHDVTAAHPTEAKALRRLATELSGSNGQFEKGDAQKWPEALRRGMQGDVDAAEEVGALLDDARLDIRRKAAQVTYGLHARAAEAYAKRALDHGEDPDVRRYAALALVRMGDPASPEAEAALADPSSTAWRRRAALAFAEQGDARGGAELATAWEDESDTMPFEDARVLLAAIAKIREARAVPGLLKSLEDVRLRPYVADALGAIGEGSARPALLAAFDDERYVTTRPHELRALVALGARQDLRPALLRFAGTPDPLREALPIARELHLLGPEGWSSEQPVAEMSATLRPPSVRETGPSDAGTTESALRLVVLAAGSGKVTATVAGHPADMSALPNDAPEAPAEGVDAGVAPPPPVLHVAELGELPPGPVPVTVAVQREGAGEGGLLAVWLIRRTEEVPPPAPVPWDGGPDVDPGPPAQ